ncbi:P2 family phage major capsid protein [Escherichia coli]|nr:P2 family phage major capsid protein [Escherichia coli]
MIISQKRMGGLQAVRAPFFPPNALLITRLDNCPSTGRKTPPPFSYRQPRNVTGLKTLNPLTKPMWLGLPLRRTGGKHPDW